MPSFRNTIAALGAMSGKLDEVKSKADTVAPALEKTRAAATDAKKEFDILDSLFERSKEKQNDFSHDFELTIEQVRLGAIDITELITKFGDAKIATEDGFKTIRELFSGADLGKYRQEIQGFIDDIRTGGADIDKILGFLKENAGELAAGLINVLQLFKQGKASLEDVQRVIEAMKQAYGGVEAGALGDAIEQALLGGLL